MSWGNYTKTIKIKDFNLKNLKGMFVLNCITNITTMQIYEINALQKISSEVFINLLKSHNKISKENNSSTNYPVRLNHFDRASRIVYVENQNITFEKSNKECLEMDLELSPNRQLFSTVKNQEIPQKKTIPSEIYFYSKEELIKVIPEIIEWKKNHSKNDETFNIWKKKFDKILIKAKLNYEQRIIQETQYS